LPPNPTTAAAAHSLGAFSCLCADTKKKKKKR